MRIPRSPCPRASGIAAILASLGNILPLTLGASIDANLIDYPTASTVTSLATYSPGPSYSVGVPSSSSISSSSTGSIYFQLSASTSYQWVSLGIGTQMAGATMFIMYADGNGNVTLSARAGGAGHVEPQVDSTLTSGVELLAGSGIVGGKMIANVKCSYSRSQPSSRLLREGGRGAASAATDHACPQVHRPSYNPPRHPPPPHGSQLGLRVVHLILQIPRMPCLNTKLQTHANSTSISLKLLFPPIRIHSSPPPLLQQLARRPRARTGLRLHPEVGAEIPAVAQQ